MLKVVLAPKFSFVPYNMISTIMWLKHDPENLFENVKLKPLSKDGKHYTV